MPTQANQPLTDWYQLPNYRIRKVLSCGGIGEDFIRRVITLLLNRLREVHSNKLLHLDIKPANIYIRNDGALLRKLASWRTGG